MPNLVHIKSYVNRVEADTAKSFLESNGIKALVSGDDEGGMNPFLLNATGGAKLLVQEEDKDEAFASWKAKQVLTRSLERNFLL